MDTTRDDSPLSKAANITDIMRFGVAVLRAAWLWIDAIHKAREGLNGIVRSERSQVSLM